MEIHIMQTISRVILALSALTCSVSALAQSVTTPVTHEQLLAELARLEQVGYRPSAGESDNYPEDIQAAEVRVAAQDAQSGSRMPNISAGSSSSGN
jgi:hypothetical protein